MSTQTIEEPDTITCAECGCETPFDESLGAEVDKTKVWKDVCRDCYDEIVKTCQVCGADDVMPSDVSPFILVKQEFARTADRPPGIYRVISRPFYSASMLGGGHLHYYDIRFVDKLPQADQQYEISGHICNKCAKPYAGKFKRVFGAKAKAHGFDKAAWQIERKHTRKTILKHPEMIRDLECEPDDHSDWDDLKRIYDLPAMVTHNEWLLLEHNGVKVFKTHYSDQHGDSWLLLKGDPKYRRYAYSGWNREPGVLFCASSLPTYPHYDHDAPENKGKYHDHYYWGRIHSIPAIKQAIEQGYIRQAGTFDKDGKPFIYG